MTQEERNQMLQEKMIKGFDLITDACNNFEYDWQAETMFDAFMRQHRTLQSNTMRAMFGMMSLIASSGSGRFDGRNEGVRLACQEMLMAYNVAKFGKDGLEVPYLATI